MSIRFFEELRPPEVEELKRKLDIKLRDDEIKEYYDGVMFYEDDFSCNKRKELT